MGTALTRHTTIHKTIGRHGISPVVWYPGRGERQQTVKLCAPPECTLSTRTRFCIRTCGCAACAQANIVRMSRRRVWQSHRSAIHVREKDYLACCGYGARQEGDNSASHMRPQAKRGRMCIKSSPRNMLSRGNVGVGFRCLRIPDGQGEVCLDFGSPSAWTGARTEFSSSSLDSRF